MSKELKKIERPFTFFNGSELKIKCVTCGNKFDSANVATPSIYCGAVCKTNFINSVGKIIK